MSEKKYSNPWKAFLPYDEKSALQFKGRTRNIEELFAFIYRERTTVCYAESGVGKTSLINAGLKPKLRQHLYFPVDIVFTDSDYASEKLCFDRIAIKAIKKEITNINETSDGVEFKLTEAVIISGEEICELDGKLKDSSLWWLLRTYKIECFISGCHVADYSIIFIFDQFEELFTRSKSECLIKSFFEWYSSVSSNTIPPEVADQWRKSGGTALLYDIPKTTCSKFLFSLRQDSIGTLDYWVSQQFSIPSLRNNRYCLLPLTAEQAYCVITEQGIDTLNEVADVIISELKEPNNDYVPAIMLSVYCSRLYEKAGTETDGRKKTVKAEDVSANKELLIKEYYEELLKKTGIDEKAVFIIEDCLVSNSGKRNRIANDTSEPLNSIHFDQKYRGILRDCYLINDRKDYIEIAHDKVADAISLRKKERKLKKNLRFWRFFAFLIPFLLFICSILYEVIPSDRVQRSEMHEFVLDDDEFFNPSNINGRGDTLKFFRNLLDNNGLYSNLELDSSLVGLIGLNLKFTNCPNLHRVRVSGFEYVGGHYLQFRNCPELFHIDLVDGIKYIESDFIINCPNLKSIRIPKEIISISEDAFKNDNLSFDVDSLNEHIEWCNGVLWDKIGGEIIYIQQNILDATKKIPFIDCVNKRIDRLKYRGEYVYRLNQYDTEILVNADSSVLLPSPAYKLYKSIDLSKFDKIKEIPDKLFAECADLESIVLPPSLLSIGDEAFRGCVVLKGVSFPKLLKNISPKAFENCRSLEKIEFLCNNVSIQDSAFFSCTSLDTLKFPRKVDRLGNYAFADCAKLKKVVLPVNVEECNSNTFDWCHSLDIFELQDYENSDFSITGGCVFHGNALDFLWTTNEPITHKDNRYYSENGFLYDSNNSIIAWNKHSEFDKIPRRIDSGNEWIRVRDFRYSHIDPRNGKWLLFNNLDKKSIQLPIIPRHLVTYSFARFPSEITELHIPFPQPDYFFYTREHHYVGARRIDLPVSLRKNVILYVPYNCSKYYIKHPDYQGFKDVREDALWLRIWGKVEQILYNIRNYYTFELTLLSVLGIIVFCWFQYLLGCSMDRVLGIRRRNSHTLISAALFTLFFTPICYFGVYWFSWSLVAHNIIVCFLLALILCFLIGAFTTLMQRITFSELRIKRKEIIYSLFMGVQITYMKVIKVITPIILVYMSYSCYCKYREKYSEYINNNIKTSSQYVEDSTLFKAYSYLRESNIPISNYPFNMTNVLGGNFLDGNVLSATFSPDDKHIFTISEHKTISLWNLKTGDKRVLDTLKGHLNYVKFAAFSPDRKRIVMTASGDKTAMLWNAENGEVLDTLHGHQSGVNSATFSPDGKRIVTASSDKTAMLWNAENGEVLDTLHGHQSGVNSATFSPDGKRIVTASSDKTAMLWNAENGEVLDTLRGHQSYVNSATFSPDGKRIVTASSDGTAIIWSTENGGIIHTLEGHKGSIDYATFSPHDGKMIVTVSYDETAMLWDSETGNELATLKGLTVLRRLFSQNTLSTAFSHDGRRIVATSGSRTIGVWDVDLLLNEKKYKNYTKKISKEYPLSEEEKDRIGFNYIKYSIPLLLLGIIIVISLCYVVIYLLPKGKYDR